MRELIYKQDAKDAVDMALDTIDHVPEWVYDILLNSLDKVPSAEPERKKGKWIRNRDEDGWRMWLECAECGAIEQNLNSNYCHNCGSYNGG